MGTILFDTPRIADKAKNDLTGTRYKQKGPTCWYYAAKMLTRLHHIQDSGSIDMRALHWVRKILTDLNIDAPLIGEDQTENLDRIRNRLITERNWWRSLLDQHDTALSRYQAIPGSQFTKHDWMVSVTRVKMTLKVDSVATARRKYGEIERALEQMRTATDMGRFSLLQKFASGLFQKFEVETNKVDTPDKIEAMLRKVGPFYASGYLFSLHENRRDVDTSGMSDVWRKDSLAEVLKLENDAHAIVVTGVNTASGNVYYKDPNRTDQIRVIPYSRFISSWPSGTSVCTAIALKCPQRHDSLNSQGGCAHTAQAIQLDTEQVIIGGLFD